jgi:U3 small nucleolar RNA-associated protein 25
VAELRFPIGPRLSRDVVVAAAAAAADPSRFRFRFRFSDDASDSPTAKSPRALSVAAIAGLVTRLQESGANASDFLSSIEVLIIDHADVIAAQNWNHVVTAVRSVNALPKETHGTDVMRVHETHLNGHAKHLRQTVLLSSHASAEMNALMRNECANVEGRARWKATHAGVLGLAALSARRATGGCRQQFERVPDAPIDRADDARFKHFTRRILPKLRENPQPGSLLFVRSYLDFVRVRNALTKAEVSFCVNSEYTDAKNAARARSLFADGRKRVLLVTERAHFYHRRRIRGAREVFFYSLPDREAFYAETLSFLGGDASGDADGTRLSAPTATVAFSAYDALQLERVVGSKRAKKMLAPDANSTFIFT